MSTIVDEVKDTFDYVVRLYLKDTENVNEEENRRRCPVATGIKRSEGCPVATSSCVDHCN